MPQLNSTSNILKIAFPIAISGLATNIIGIIDTVFLARLGENQLGAVGNGNLLYFIFVFIGYGFTTGVQIIAGRRNGEENYKDIGKLLIQAFYFIVLYSIISIAIVWLFSDAFINQVSSSQIIGEYSSEFINWRIAGTIFAMSNYLIMAFFVGITRTKILTIMTAIMAIINIILDYALIFGHWGLPEMGIKGAALASVIAEASVTVCYILYLRLYLNYEKYGLFIYYRFVKKEISDVLQVAGPTMLQFFLSISAWFFFFSIIEHIGPTELAASHIVRAIYAFFMLPAGALGDACSTITSNLLGQKNEDGMFETIKNAAVASFVTSAVFILLCFSIPTTVISLFTSSPALIEAATAPLKVISVSTVILSLGFIFFKTLLGTGQTRVGFKFEIYSVSGYMIYTVLAYWLHAPVWVIWLSEIVYFGLMAGLSYEYLISGKWKGKNI